MLMQKQLYICNKYILQKNQQKLGILCIYYFNDFWWSYHKIIKYKYRMRGIGREVKGWQLFPKPSIQILISRWGLPTNVSKLVLIGSRTHLI